MSSTVNKDGFTRHVRVIVRDRVKTVLGAHGYELHHVARMPHFDQFIDLGKTLDGARKAGLPVGDYIDVSEGQAGTTGETMEQLARLGVFDDVHRVCEIGPGTGRYLCRTIDRCQPEYYEIYETSTAWREWLTRHYPVTVQSADGRTLGPTPMASVDLVQAHKVFGGTPALTTVRYLLEMMRVVRPGGRVVFDVVTEDCLDEANLNAWVSASNDYEGYPAFMPKQVVLGLFARNGFSCLGSFVVSMKPGVTEYFAFERQG